MNDDEKPVDLPCFVFDVESIGLHGEGFAVAGGLYLDGKPIREFCFACPPSEARGGDADRAWVKSHVPQIPATHATPREVRDAFWEEWELARGRGITTMYGECLWPVEAGFVAACIRDRIEERKWSGPYPFHDVASVMLAAGMDPMTTYERREGEEPAHHPLRDARQSARLLHEALSL